MKTVTVETSQLTGPALDWAVAKSVAKENVKIEQCRGADAPAFCVVLTNGTHWTPSTNWSQGGPLIEQHRVWISSTCTRGAVWDATVTARTFVDAAGPTPLIAAMRAIVAAELGDAVEVPAELGEVGMRKPGWHWCQWDKDGEWACSEWRGYNWDDNESSCQPVVVGERIPTPDEQPPTPCPDGGKCYKKGDTCGDPICVERHADLLAAAPRP